MSASQAELSFDKKHCIFNDLQGAIFIEQLNWNAIWNIIVSDAGLVYRYYSGFPSR